MVHEEIPPLLREDGCVEIWNTGEEVEDMHAPAQVAEYSRSRYEGEEGGYVGVRIRPAGGERKGGFGAHSAWRGIVGFSDGQMF
ncbi:predicted protein [Histoplasma mississippiense (nom. inval.)]|uniref:predicted protein n=1 Tax=Ajellomyces capsulatus (strain NAm1 / WU24) TaxID=2059318 RepID=UPI000157B527|nr:predicted protein [Histoplasma mississippiense (nom. inval.)]EDN02581.1 predicted protein [Histoplasma mississippiense (nom. inval.)]